MRALVIGNVALDEIFDAAALPRVGETLLASGVTSDLGGKGANQAVVLARCGVPTRLIARVGHDDAAARLRTLLAPEPLDASGVATIDRPTDRSVVLRAQDGGNCIVSSAACAHAITETDVSGVLRGTQANTILLLQGNLTQATTTHALRLARENGLRTVLNPAPAASWFSGLWSMVDLAILNELEASELSGRCQPEDAARHIHDAGAGRVAVTLGREGALLCDAIGLTKVAAAPVPVRDTIGAGDTFTAVLVAGLLVRGLGTHAAMRAAARAAALTVSRAGTLASFPTPQELAAILAGS